MKRFSGIGTSTRRVPNMSQIAAGVSRPGIDTRHWVSFGTVGVAKEDGSLDVTDKGAVYIGPEGVEVDVLLEPLNIPVTAHYAGIYGGGSTTIFAPINPGDQVIVVMPDGGTQNPVIVGVLHSAAVKVPIGTDRKPVFKNDRVLIYSKTVPVEVHAANIKLGSGSSGEPLVLGAKWKAWTTQLMDLLSTRFMVNTALGPSGPAIASTKAELDQLKAKLDELISGKAYTEK